jgi:putative peptide zinc metalloprotease protein
MAVLYVLVWLAVPLLFLLHPAVVPSASKGILHTRVLLNLVVLEVLGWALVFLHELAHCLAARAYGCPCFVTMGRRLYFLVAQTDLTATRTLPRRQRYGPYLAGMTWDLLLLLACTLWQLTPLRSPLAGALAYLLLTGLIFQFAFFLRTDLYFVFTNRFRLGNLMQDTQHWLANLVCRLLRRATPYDLESIPSRELRIIRWYALFYVIGVAVALADFLLLGLPLLLHLSSQALLGMSAGPTQLSFWDGTGYLLVVLLDFGLLFFVTYREYRVRHQASDR